MRGRNPGKDTKNDDSASMENCESDVGTQGARCGLKCKILTYIDKPDFNLLY